MSDNHAKDVEDFAVKFGVQHRPDPGFMTPDVFTYRLTFLEEELDEFSTAHDDGELAETVDGLLDLIYVAYGTLLLMGLNANEINECWDEVQRANMTKERSTSGDDPRSKRGHLLDVVKPEGWQSPDIRSILQRIKMEGR